MPNAEVFAVPILGNFLIHAPVHQLSALVDCQAVHLIQQNLTTPQHPIPNTIKQIFQHLQLPPHTKPSAKTGAVDSPLFLGIIPTRGCNMGCRYCDFAAPKSGSPVMTMTVAKASVNAYISLLEANNHQHGEIQFFGGEPFFAEEVVQFIVGYSKWQAARKGITIRLEVTTNGLFNTQRCQWIADHFDAVVLSLDGPEDIQTRHRPGINGRSVSNIIIRNAKIFSESTCELVIRPCVTQQTVSRLPEIAHWIAQTFLPATVCFESLILSPLAAAANLSPPDPWLFAQNFITASNILAKSGIETILSSADISRTQVTFCPVGKDALIVSPEGNIDACYLLEETWQEMDLNMRLGTVNLTSNQFQLDDDAVQQVRSYQVENKPGCANCFCKYHCAGGCHVTRATNHAPGHYNDWCIQTRLVTIAHLLQQLQQSSTINQLFTDRRAMETAVFQPNDHLHHLETA
ncbi:MAG: radical SAM protein [Chloroflexi bacterium]|nr:MAG: radical SAM protein [Chloroflexota bacterium]